MIELPNECFSEIFNNFQNCYKTLFSCLLVNRQWCRNIIPILWSKPLDNFKDARIIKIYLSTLNVEEQKPLIPFGIIISNNQKPLFNYTIYTTSIIDDNLSKGIVNWLDNEISNSREIITDSDSYENLIQVIKFSLITMLLRTSEILKFVAFNESVNDKIIKMLIEILYKNISIKTLSICFNNLSSIEGKMLMEALYRNNTINFFRLSDNQLGINEGRANQVKFDFTEDLPSISYSLNEPYDGTYLNMLYLTGSLPISTSNESIIPKCEKIEIICESHDQGWSSYPQDQGTYNNSWTWGEVSIVSSRQNNNLQDQLTEINEEVIEKESNVRYEIYRNRHADSDWQTHQYEFVSEHPLVQNLQPGDMVGLWIRSIYPCWCNYIRRAEIKFYYTI